jgi:hypothetical protein
MAAPIRAPAWRLHPRVGNTQIPRAIGRMVEVPRSPRRDRETTSGADRLAGVNVARDIRSQGSVRGAVAASLTSLSRPPRPDFRWWPMREAVGLFELQVTRPQRLQARVFTAHRIRGGRPSPAWPYSLRVWTRSSSSIPAPVSRARQAGPGHDHAPTGAARGEVPVRDSTTIATAGRASGVGAPVTPSCASAPATTRRTRSCFRSHWRTALRHAGAASLNLNSHQARFGSSPLRPADWQRSH